MNRFHHITPSKNVKPPWWHIAFLNCTGKVPPPLPPLYILSKVSLSAEKEILLVTYHLFHTFVRSATRLPYPTCHIPFLNPYMEQTTLLSTYCSLVCLTVTTGSTHLPTLLSPPCSFAILLLSYPFSNNSLKLYLVGLSSYNFYSLFPFFLISRRELYMSEHWMTEEQTYLIWNKGTVFPII